MDTMTWARRLGVSVILLAGSGLAVSGDVADRVRSSSTVKVCVWPAYFGITYRASPGAPLIGLDAELSQEFAKDLGVQRQTVDSSFATLIDDLVSGKCDVAMFAVGVLPQRQAHLQFTQPYLKSDIYGIAKRDDRSVRDWTDIDRPGVRVAVQAGTFMEPVMTEALKQSKLVVVKPPQTREQALQAGEVDVFMTDFPYSRRLLSQSDEFRLIRPTRPFFELPYAYAVKPGDDAWFKQVDAFVSRIKRDGRLAAAAGRHGLTDIMVSR